MSGAKEMVLDEAQRKWLLATPLQEPADAGFIAWRAGVSSGSSFAAFARKNPSLFQRLPKIGSIAWTYRLSPTGAALANELRTRTPDNGAGS